MCECIIIETILSLPFLVLSLYYGDKYLKCNVKLLIYELHVVDILCRALILFCVMEIFFFSFLKENWYSSISASCIACGTLEQYDMKVNSVYKVYCGPSIQALPILYK
jgi:hypothetical protein